jgi:hypothetical protein
MRTLTMIEAVQGKVEFSHLGIGTVLQRDRLVVPVHQREYSWKPEHVLDLLHDLSDAIDNNRPAYFLGTVVLTTGKHPGALEVTDGQQRLATTTILLAAIRDYLYSRPDAKVVVKSLDDFLYKADRDLNDTVPRLTLNVDDREFFKNRILPPPDDERRRIKATKWSHERIEEATDEARKHVQRIVAEHKVEKHTQVLNRWITFLEHNAQVVIFKVPGDVDAYLMFETLNDRGLKANQSDMLKSYLIGQARPEEQAAQQKWSAMKVALEAADESDEIVLTYLRHLLVARYGAVRDREVYGRIKEVVSGQGPSLAFLEELADSAVVYTALLNHRHPHWQQCGNAAPKIRHHVETLIELRQEQIRPLMFACMKRFTPREIAKAFRVFISWAVRFMVTGTPTGVVEKYYAGRAEEVWRKKITSAADLVGAMNRYLPDDEAFQNSFARLRVAKPHLARYYLRSIDREMKADKEPEYVVNDDETEVTLEHVLPQSPGQNWPHVTEEQADALYRRLGNLALLRGGLNSSLGNAPFAEKRAAYRKGSSFQVNKFIVEYKEPLWGEAAINERQAAMAELAAKIWPLSVRQ